MSDLPKTSTTDLIVMGITPEMIKDKLNELGFNIKGDIVGHLSSEMIQTLLILTLDSCLLLTCWPRKGTFFPMKDTTKISKSKGRATTLNPTGRQSKRGRLRSSMTISIRRISTILNQTSPSTFSTITQRPSIKGLITMRPKAGM